LIPDTIEITPEENIDVSIEPLSAGYFQWQGAEGTDATSASVLKGVIDRILNPTTEAVFNLDLNFLLTDTEQKRKVDGTRVYYENVKYYRII
jgi:hypothetical protein